MRDRGSGSTEALLRSPSLYLGEIRVIEQQDGRGPRRWGGRRIKDRLLPVLYWFLRKAPVPLALAPFYLIVGLCRLLYWMPGNPLRQSCEDICAVAARTGRHHDPAEIYRQFLRNVLGAARGYRCLLRDGPDAAAALVDTSGIDREQCDEILRRHGAFILIVPHNLSSAYSGVALARIMPMLLVMRNSSTIRRTRLALEVFERMQTRILMVRGGNAFELSRAMFAALADGQVLGATVDNVERHGGVTANVFGVDVGLGAWAAKIAARKRVPVVPAYFHSTPGGVRVEIGEPFVDDDAARLVRYYAAFFERCILADPSSWAYLADRKWRRVLRLAAAT